MVEKSIPYYSWLLVYIFLFFRPESYIQRFGSSVAKKWLHLRPATENQGRHLHVLRSNRYLRYILPLLREITLIWIYMTCFSFCAVLCVKLHLARKIFLNLISIETYDHCWKLYTCMHYIHLYWHSIPGISTHSYSEHIYNELMLTLIEMLFLVTYVVNLMDITNCAYNKAKLPVPSTSS